MKTSRSVGEGRFGKLLAGNRCVGRACAVVCETRVLEIGF